MGALKYVAILAALCLQCLGGDVVVLAALNDPYRSLAEEIARADGLPVVSTVGEATTVLWVVAPSRLSDRVMTDWGRRLRERPLSIGIITGRTAENARALWLRGKELRSGPSSAFVAGLSASPVKESIQHQLATGRYVTFAGHGASSYWNLGEGEYLRSEDIPATNGVVVGTASCNTFRLWEPGSIALEFAEKGAAGYAGFVFSPVAGFLMGGQGLPWAATWPDFPIGAAVAVQNRGTIKAFAAIPYYWWLGDPRIALSSTRPYQFTESLNGGERVVRFAAGAGIVAIRVRGAEGWSPVEKPFYEDDVQSVRIGDSWYVLVRHGGGDGSLLFRRSTHWAEWVLAGCGQAFEHTWRIWGRSVWLALGAAVIGLWFAQRGRIRLGAVLVSSFGLAPGLFWLTLVVGMNAFVFWPRTGAFVYGWPLVVMPLVVASALVALFSCVRRAVGEVLASRRG